MNEEIVTKRTSAYMSNLIKIQGQTRSKFSAYLIDSKDLNTCIGYPIVIGRKV